MSLLARHSLAWIAPSCRDVALQAAAHPSDADEIARWIDLGRPFVVARLGPVLPALSIRSPRIALGLPLPPAQGKRRIAFAVPHARIARLAPPLTLHAAAAALSHLSWRESLAALDNSARAEGIELRVFGSVAWQALTGLAYLTAHSDLDLYWRVHTRIELERGLRCLGAWRRAGTLPIDGEIVFPNDAAVGIREWTAHRSDTVLVKTFHDVRLERRADVMALLAAADTASA